MRSGNPDGLSPHIRVITGNKRRWFIFGNEGIDHLQYVFRYIVFTGNHDDRKLWLNALYFCCNLMPIHIRHVVVNNHGGHSGGRRNLYAVSS